MVDYTEARLWWRSRTPQEKEQGFDVYRYELTPFIYITVPVPFCGHVEVSILSMKGTKNFKKAISKRGLIYLRNLYLSKGSKGWKIRKNDKNIVFYRAGKLLDRRSAAERSGVLWP